MSLARLWTKGASLRVNGEVPLVIYRSARSKLRVAVADVPGPMVKGVLSFVTETHSDDGLPHTLEHLVFMGSKKYPFKGMLDLVANRCLASGTNAWTDQDHTAYTLSTVGSDGFLKVLPVYMDHLLSPTLTEDQFVTEVHHVTGEGCDAGVVYSEMQDHESEMDEVISRKRKELVYPDKNSYRVETGGRLYALRSTCSNSAVRNFHNDFYHLSNMMLVVCGLIDHEKLLNIVSSVEEEMLNKIPPSFSTPFCEEVPCLKENLKALIECPSDDEQVGQVQISWLGPPASDLYKSLALEVLFEYMESTSVAPLQKDFVQLEDPFASFAYFSISEQSTSEIVATFCGVPVDKLEQIEERLFTKTLSDHCNPKAFDMERLGFVIKRSILKTNAKMETDCHNTVFHMLIGHQIYGKGDDHLAERINKVEYLKRLGTEPAEFWSNLISSLCKDHHVCVVGLPSGKKVEEFTKMEEKRIEDQRNKLGKEGLNDCEMRVKTAVERNTANKPSEEVLSELIVRDLENFNTFDVRTLDNCALEGSFVDGIPLRTFLHRASTKFIDLLLAIDTSNIDVNLRMWLMLFSELLFESPARIGNEVVSYEEVAKLFTRDLMSQSFSVGVFCGFTNYVALRMKVPAVEYRLLANWAEIFLRGVVFEPSRVTVSAKKLAAQAAEAKREGNSVCSTLITETIRRKESNSHIYGIIQLEKFHAKVAKRSVKDGAWVVAQLEALRDALLKAPMNLHLACDESKLPSNIQADGGWSFLNRTKGECSIPFKSCCAESFSPDAFGKQLLVGVGGSESSFLRQVARFEHDWMSDETLAALLFSQYLSQVEGPLYRSVRGAGLAYDASVSVHPDEQTIIVSLYRSVQVNQAYEQTKNTVMDILNSGKVDLNEFEAAKRSLICEIVGAEDTVKGAIQQSILSQLRGTPPNFTREFCMRVWKANASDVLEKASASMRALFDESQSARAVVVHPSKVKEVQKHFKGIRLQTVDDLALRPSAV